jgi:hypothetical protein
VLAHDVYKVIDSVSSQVRAERAKICDTVKVSDCLLATCADIRHAEVELAQARLGQPFKGLWNQGPGAMNPANPGTRS